MARIVNLKREPHAVANGAVRIDRRTPWGNPFAVGRDGTRLQVIARYRADLWRRMRAGEIAVEAVAALDGRDLACHCPAALPRRGACPRRRLGGSRASGPGGRVKPRGSQAPIERGGRT